jgi:hypothetical protein
MEFSSESSREIKRMKVAPVLKLFRVIPEQEIIAVQRWQQVSRITWRNSKSFSCSCNLELKAHTHRQHRKYFHLHTKNCLQPAVVVVVPPHKSIVIIILKLIQELQ